MVEHRLPKPVVAGSIPVSRSTISRVFSPEEPVLTVHWFVFDSWFSAGWGGAGVHPCSRRLKANI